MVDMFLMRQPSEQEIKTFIAAQQDKPFSYSPTGITCNPPASGYNVDHNRVELGSGLRSFEAAIAAIRRWKMFDLGWVSLYRNDTPIEIGSTVAVVVSHLGFWSMNACRIVYLVGETSGQERYGFAYGTLAEHAERGEERFMVEWNKADGSVWYDILAISKPGPIARLGYPYARGMQKRFANDSKRAMMRAVAEAVV
ncbi:MAG: DUF1990 domain-containing protein [Blastocatellia bacterium]